MCPNSLCYRCGSRTGGPSSGGTSGTRFIHESSTLARNTIISILPRSWTVLFYARRIIDRGVHVMILLDRRATPLIAPTALIQDHDLDHTGGGHVQGRPGAYVRVCVVRLVSYRQGRETSCRRCCSSRCQSPSGSWPPDEGRHRLESPHAVTRNHEPRQGQKCSHLRVLPFICQFVCLCARQSPSGTTAPDSRAAHVTPRFVYVTTELRAHSGPPREPACSKLKRA